jgi:hypothetical protein
VPIALKENAGSATDYRGASAADLSAFEKQDPVRARQIHAFRSTSYISTSTGCVGALAGGLMSYRATRAPQFVVIGTLLGGLTAAAMADDVGSTSALDLVQEFVHRLSMKTFALALTALVGIIVCHSFLLSTCDGSVGFLHSVDDSSRPGSTARTSMTSCKSIRHIETL